MPNSRRCGSARRSLATAIAAARSSFAAIYGPYDPLAGVFIRKSTTSQAQAMQVDWGECGRVQVGAPTRKVSVFVAVLCHSRLIYIEFTLSRRKAEFFGGIVDASQVLRWPAPCHHLRQFKGRGDQRLGPVSLFSSDVLGGCVAISACSRSPANGATRVKRNRRGERALHRTQCPRRTRR